MRVTLIFRILLHDCALNVSHVVLFTSPYWCMQKQPQWKTISSYADPLQSFAHHHAAGIPN